MTRIVLLGIAAGLASSCAGANGPAAPVTPTAAAAPAPRSGAAFSLSVRPTREAVFTIGRPFSYWLELKNMSKQAIAVKSDLSIMFSYSQGEGGGGSGNVHWAPCQSETYLVGPGQTLAQLAWIESRSIDPGSAVLEFSVTVREANPDGTCAKREHDAEAEMPVTVLPGKTTPAKATPAKRGRTPGHKK